MKKSISANLVILCFFLQGCGNGPGSPGVLRVGNSAEPATLDLHQATGQPEFRIIGALFEGLVARGEQDGEVRPGAAHAWEVSGDGRTYTFHLRPARWSDGEPLTASDFVQSWRRFIDPRTGSQYAALLDVVEGAKDVREGRLPPDSLGASARDDSTFIVRLKRPVGFFLQLCAFEPLFPVPVDSVERHQENWTRPEHMVCNGPYRLSGWTRNVELRLKRNSLYWDSAAVRQPEIVFKPVEDQLTAYNMFLSGELDWIFSIPPSKIEAASRMDEYFSRPSFGTYYFSVNCSKPGYDSPALRKALSYAIDRRKIVEHVLKGGQQSARGFVPPLEGYPGVDLELHDPERARRHLAESGFGPDNPPPRLEILYNNSETHKSVAEVVRQMWKEVLGLDAELVNYEWKVYLENTKNLNYSSVARASWIGDFADPITFLELAATGNGNNRTGYSNAEYDRLLDASWTIQDPVERMRRLARAESLLLEEMPVIPIYYYTINELRHPGLKGAAPNALGMYSWKNIYLEPPEG